MMMLSWGKLAGEIAAGRLQGAYHAIESDKLCAIAFSTPSMRT